MNRQVSGFMDFVREQGVVGLAVGLAIGVQVSETTKALVDGLINPIVRYLLSFIMSNPQSLESVNWKVTGGKHPLIVGWGLILSFLIKLVAVAAVIYFVVHGFKLDRIDKKKEDKKEEKK
jgi:large-conductance mechanosensitive channel